MDARVPFRGSTAIDAGLLTPKVLRGPRYRRLWPDVYVAAGATLDFELRSRAAYLLVENAGALAGFSAAAVLGVPCEPAGAAIEVVTPHRMRSRPGLRVRQESIHPAELTCVDGVVATSPLRTAYDLGRRKPLVDAVIAVDAITHAYHFSPRELIAMSYLYAGARGHRQLPEVVGRANPLAESPMETRIRLAIVLAGLPQPVVQHQVGSYRLDLAYPELRLAVEYDGADHRSQKRAMRDLVREAYLVRAGWTVLRFTAAEVHNPAHIAARVRSEIAARRT